MHQSSWRKCSSLRIAGSSKFLQPGTLSNARMLYCDTPSQGGKRERSSLRDSGRNAPKLYCNLRYPSGRDIDLRSCILHIPMLPKCFDNTTDKIKTSIASASAFVILVAFSVSSWKYEFLHTCKSDCSHMTSRNL